MFTPVVVFPDTETALRQYLETALAGRAEPYAAGVKVNVKVPDVIPDRFIWVRDDGGGQPSGVTRAVGYGVNVYAKTRDEASDLANLVRALLLAAPGSAPFVAVDPDGFNGPYGVTDPSKRPRFYITCELHVRGTAL